MKKYELPTLSFVEIDFEEICSTSNGLRPSDFRIYGNIFEDGLNLY